VGALRPLSELTGPPAGPAIAVVGEVDFERAAAELRDARERGWDLRGAIVQGDDAVLIGNRVGAPMPIVDEVAAVDALPAGALAAVEVAEPGGSVTELGDPLRLAVLLGLDPAEARAARNAARHALGNRCAVVVLQPTAAPGPVTADDGAEPAIEADDTFAIPLPAPAGDAAFHLRLRRRRVEGIATLRARAAEDLAGDLGAIVVCEEPVAAMCGAATTPGAGSAPFVLDLGGGTVDLHRAGQGVVLAGAGELVTRICAGLLGCPPELGERAKRRRSVRVETPFILHHEDGSRSFRGTPAPPGCTGRLCLLEGREPVPLPAPLAPEVWGELRRRAKRDVLVANARRAIERAGGVPRGELVTLVGGCAVDHEVVEEVAAGLADLDLTVARGDVLGRHGPRAAVAVGLVLAHAEAG
jgi:Diol dehydratase reactivase ATPase-like domain/DD-reactivating factor swiveling domain